MPSHILHPSLFFTQNFWKARQTKASRYRLRTVRDPSAALELLEKRLAAAEAKREAVLHAVRLRARATASRAAAVARAEVARRRQLKHRLEQSLEAADAARAAHLANTAARAARISSRAHANARVAKQREQTETASKLTTLLHRMKRAATFREQVMAAKKDRTSSNSPMSVSMVGAGKPTQQHRTLSNSPRVYASIAKSGSAGTNSARHFVIGPNAGEWLRRQAAARRLQRRWRSFASGPKTTQSLASAFDATGIPFSVALGSSEEESQANVEVAESCEDEEMSLPRAEDFNDDADEVLDLYSEDHMRLETGGMGLEPSLGSSPPQRCPSPISTLRPRYFTGGRTTPTNTPVDNTPVDTPLSVSPRVRGPITPAIAVPIPTPTAAAAAAAAAARHQLPLPREQRRTFSGPPAAFSAPESIAMEVGSAPTGLEPASEPSMAWSPSPRRQPVARLASSLADMTAAVAIHENNPAPRPASYHASALPFDEFAEAMSATATLRSAQALLKRLEALGILKKSLAGGTSACEGLLRRLFPRLPKGKVPDRYPSRAFLSAYMILAHPGEYLKKQ